MFKIIFILYFCIFRFSFADIVENNVFNCPNNGEPKRDIESGELIQCLPGWSSEATCGPNYSCFFSGFNYQCCPTDGNENNNDELINQKLNKEEKKSENEGDECPDDALAVLDSSGNVMHCDGAGKCPQAKMFCFSETGVVSETSVCCENFFYKEDKNEQKELINKNSEETKHFLHSNVLNIPTEVLEETSKTTINSFEDISTNTVPITSKISTTKQESSTISLLSATSSLNHKNVDDNSKQFKNKVGENGPKYEIKDLNEEEKNIQVEEGQNNEEIDDNDSAKNFLLEQIK
uniref:EB domain-containing protein n=1 Tax=Meloidogyne hapla TaxID=6305 RepID=A0A1I8BQM8_MELHA